MILLNGLQCSECLTSQLLSAGLRSLSAAAVVHCSDAWAFSLCHTDGWSICYSGDTRPCEAVQRLAQNCTLLIHEATFEPALINQARALI